MVQQWYNIVPFSKSLKSAIRMELFIITNIH